MTDSLIEKIESQVDQLIARCAKLESEAAELRERENLWQEERAKLIEKNAKARTRVEAMIAHLKNLTANAESSPS